MEAYLTEKSPPTFRLSGGRVGPPFSTPPWRASLSTARKHCKYKLFSAPPVFKSCLKPRNVQGFMWLSGKQLHKQKRLCLRCLGFKNGRTLSKTKETCVGKVFFSAFGGFNKANIYGIDTVLCAFPAQNPVNIDGFKLYMLQSGHKLG